MHMAISQASSFPVSLPGKANEVNHSFALCEVTLYHDKAPISGRSVYIVVESDDVEFQESQKELKNHLASNCANCHKNNDKCGVANKLRSHIHDQTATLLHPWTLQQFTVPMEDFLKGKGVTYWPVNDSPQGESFNVDKLTERMTFLIEDYTMARVSFPGKVSRNVLAALKGCKVEDLQIMSMLPDEVKPGLPATRPVRSSNRVVKQNMGRVAGKPGVISTICELLKKGVTMDECIDELSTVFPDRKPESMTSTFKCQTGRDLPKKGLKITKTEVKGRGVVFTWVNWKEVQK